MILPRSFYTRSDIHTIAKELLGKILTSQINGEITKGRIVELEVYKAPEDKASHAHNNLRTKRTEIMFQLGGCSYVYLCYGIHSMFNVVTGKEGEAHAILIRALEPLENIDLMKIRVKTKKKDVLLCSGPGSLCKAMNITRDQNGIALSKQTSTIFIEEDGYNLASDSIVKGPRVGIAYAQDYAHKPWRYYIKNNPSVSKPYIVTYNF